MAAVSVPNLIERSGETFPGSAYFFAQDAFDPAPGASGAANGLPARWRGNRHILAIDIGPAAASYRFVGRTPVDRLRALSCLTNAIYYEAANEPEEGQRAVAQVVLNRLRSPDWPNSICGVVYQGTERDDLRCQFTFSCDGSMARIPNGDKWLRARRVAEEALGGKVFEPAGLATYYHTLTVFPGWATQMHASAIIGAHIFYRAPGPSGTPGRFRDAYAGIETINGPSANAYLDPRNSPALIPAIPVESAAAGLPPAPAPIVASPVAIASVPATLPAANPTPRVLIQSGDVKPEYLNSGRPLNRPSGAIRRSPAPVPSPRAAP
ncbi:cell wall hydrolase [Sphingobium sp. H33]|uniref:Cell wall hydrolase n=2 Tax=Sphingobium nicotianae TaxID=2782607 RepID=A0A9X1DDE1_9SPHN|nr:cell wall hydrolase [Sphingobium nicotianae]